MAQFKIIENGDSFWDKEPLFIEFYNKGMPMKQIRFKLKLSDYAYRKLLNKCSDDSSIEKRSKTKKRFFNKENPVTVKNYYYDKIRGEYVINKNRKYYASFAREDLAKKYVELMRTKYNWDYSIRKQLKNNILKGRE